MSVTNSTVGDLWIYGSNSAGQETSLWSTNVYYHVYRRPVEVVFRNIRGMKGRINVVEGLGSKVEGILKGYGNIYLFAL
jgi:hypothetical protein